MFKPEVYIIHHSATKDGVQRDFDGIKRYHINVHKWKDVGYHWVLEAVHGKLQWIKGRDESVPGVHTRGMNHKSIGICVVGNFEHDVLTAEHITMLKNKIVELDSRYGKLPIEPHSKYNATSCPGKNLNVPALSVFIRNTPPPTPMPVLVNTPSTWAKDPVDWALGAGILSGNIDTTDLRLQEHATREEVITMLYRTIKTQKL